MDANTNRKTDQNDDQFLMEEVLSEGKLVHNAGELIGSATGESAQAIVPGGWEGTDDATSTEGSDLSDPLDSPMADSPEEAALHIEEYPELKPG